MTRTGGQARGARAAPNPDAPDRPQSAGTLYVVATPLGNLEDITLRALRVLRTVHLVAAEDTRHSRKLLRHYDIYTPVVSYYDWVERSKAEMLLSELGNGHDIALISDAGTPCIADPGYRVVRAAAEAGFPVVPIPGPSAVAAALSVCGLPTDRFAFEGFLPAKRAARRGRLLELQSDPRTLVFYEAPHRVRTALDDLASVLGDRPAAIVREVTKMHESVLRATLVALRDRAAELERGEITIVVAGAPAQPAPLRSDLDAEIAALRKAGLRPTEIASELATKYALPRRAVYRRVVTSKGAAEP